MSKNFVSNSDAQALMQAIEEKKLTVSDTMPAASPELLEKTRLYIGADTASLVKGGMYQCQALQVAPVGTENPQSEGWYVFNSVSGEYELTTDSTVVAGTTYYTIEWKNISRAEVDLSHYKKIWGGSTEAWEQLTDAEKAEYEYMFFDNDSSDVFAVVDAVTKGDMHPVTSNAVANSFKWITFGKDISLSSSQSSRTELPSNFNELRINVKTDGIVYATMNLIKEEFPTLGNVLYRSDGWAESTTSMVDVPLWIYADFTMYGFVRKNNVVQTTVIDVYYR